MGFKDVVPDLIVGQSVRYRNNPLDRSVPLGKGVVKIAKIMNFRSQSTGNQLVTIDGDVFVRDANEFIPEVERTENVFVLLPLISAGKHINCASLCSSPDGNYQSNFSGTVEQVTADFIAHCQGRRYKWGKLFHVKTGNLVYEYEMPKAEFMGVKS